MKVKVNAKGEVELDVSNGESDEALRLIYKLQADARKSAAAPGLDPTKIRTGALNRTLYEVWEVLVENDCEVGVSIDAVSRQIGINNSAAGQRLLNLVKAGYARRVTLGRYRAETPENG